MKIRERLQNNKTKIQTTDAETPKKQETTEFLISDIFVNSEDITDNIIELAKNKRNMILICNKSFDKMIIADYIKSKLKNTNAEIIDTSDINTEDINGAINIVPNPSIQTVMKIFEQMVYGVSSFIFCLNFGSYDNILNKLKAVIALNYKNLSTDNINALIGASNAVLVYVSKNENGMFYISKAEEIKTFDDNIETETIYIKKSVSKKQKISQEGQIKEKSVQKEEKEIETEKDNSYIKENVKKEQPKNPVKTQNEPQKTNQKQVYIPNILADDEPMEEERGKKPNKYQILKERARQKKLSEKS